MKLFILTAFVLTLFLSCESSSDEENVIIEGVWDAHYYLELDCPTKINEERKYVDGCYILNSDAKICNSIKFVNDSMFIFTESLVVGGVTNTNEANVKFQRNGSVLNLNDVVKVSPIHSHTYDNKIEIIKGKLVWHGSLSYHTSWCDDLKLEFIK